MFLREITSVYSEAHIKHTNPVRGKTENFVMMQQLVYIYHRDFVG